MPTTLITGANRGLGLEFTRQFAHDGWRVIALSRVDPHEGKLRSLAANSDIEIEICDVSDFAAIDALATRRSGQPIDLLINNAGVFGPKAQADNDPRQSFGHVDYSVWLDVLRVNTLAPYKLVEALHQNLVTGNAKKVVTLSSTIGSISGAEPGLYAYRSSKAAVNIVMAALAKDLADSGIAVATFCPGWVNTRMGGEAAPVTPEESVSGMRRLIEGMSLDNTGQFTRFDGETVAW